MYLYIVTRLWKTDNSTVLLIFSDGYQYKNCIIHDHIWSLQKKNTAAQNLKAPVVAVNPLTLSSSCCLYSQCLPVLLFSRIRFWQSRLQVASAFQQLHCAPDNETGPASVQTLKAKCLLSSMKDNSVCVSLKVIRMFLSFQFKIERTKSWVQHFFFKGQNTLGAVFFSANPPYKNFKITKMS